MINDTVKDIIAPCLWGAAVNLLDLEADKFLIIERVLEQLFKERDCMLFVQPAKCTYYNKIAFFRHEYFGNNVVHVF